MTSDQFSEKPLPPDKKRCPHCGEPVSRRGQVCWLCRQAYVQEAPAKRRPPVPFEKKSDNTIWMVFGILAALIVAGLMFEWPGLLIVTVLMVILAMARSAQASKQEKLTNNVQDMASDSLAPEDEPAVEAPVHGAVRSFASGVAIAFATCVAFFATFFVSCTAIFMGGAALDHAFGNNGALGAIIVLAALGGGFVAAIFVASRVGKSASPGRSKR